MRRSSAGGAVAAVAVLVVTTLSAAPTRVVAGTRSPTAAQANTWVPAASMGTPRSGQTATLLRDGDVLVAGGGTTSAELYHPASNSWSPTAPMGVARTGATATLLGDGRVLVAGGCCKRSGAGLRSAELYDPSTARWTATGALNVPRVGHTATLLPDGEVLVAGGACQFGCTINSFFNNLTSAELYDPATGGWTRTGSMHDSREFHTATLLANGEVLVAGGFSGCDDSFCSDVAGAELYSQATGRWTATGSMHVPREQHSATLLPGGRVLVAGGLDQGGFGNPAQWSSAEVFDPATGTWSATASMAQVHVGHTATLLSNGWVLVAGGETAAAELYEPAASLWATPGPLSTPRTGHTATLLPDGRVLAAGGAGPDGHPQATAELYVTGRGPLVSLSPVTLVFGSRKVGTTSHVLAVVVRNEGSANLVVAGLDVTGANPGDFVASTDCTAAAVAPRHDCSVSVRFTPGAVSLREAAVGIADNAPQSPQTFAVSGYGIGPNSWALTGRMASARDSFAATRLPDGRVLVAGGEDPAANLYDMAGAELYDPSTRTFSATGPLHTARAEVTATLLGDGDVLVAGGKGANFANLASAELYHPASGTWTSGGTMAAGGYSLTQTLLPDGRVLVTGQGSGADAEVYDPASNTWSSAGPMHSPHFLGTATLLADGTVLVAGGGTAVAELYDPAHNSWTLTGAMQVARQRQTATLLAGGKVLVAGGEPPGGGAPLASAELYDPTTRAWTLTGSLNTARAGHTATLVTGGTVLVAGGCTSYCNPNILASSELYDPTYGYWELAPAMTTPREAQAATLLADGSVLVTGGDSLDCCTPTRSAEIYTPGG